MGQDETELTWKGLRNELVDHGADAEDLARLDAIASRKKFLCMSGRGGALAALSAAPRRADRARARSVAAAGEEGGCRSNLSYPLSLLASPCEVLLVSVWTWWITRCGNGISMPSSSKRSLMHFLSARAKPHCTPG